MGIYRRKASGGNCCAADPATAAICRHEHGEEAGADDPEAAATAARDAAVPHLPLQARQGQRLREARRDAPEQVGRFAFLGRCVSLVTNNPCRID